MGTKIQSNCPRCGEVEMRPEDILLYVGVDGDSGSYTFLCPTCDQVVEKRADRKIIELLNAIDDVKLEAIHDVDWDAAFNQELSCNTGKGGTHRWDFPVKMGQKCLCGQKEWTN